ncbi:MAG: hypothetical protein Q9174_006070, partial [Haloplaca sp. 1 TL-2023]
MWQQIIAAKDQTIGIQQDQIVDLKGEVKTLGKECSEAKTETKEVYVRASKCHRKAICKESESKDTGNQQAEPQVKSASAAAPAPNDDVMQMVMSQVVGAKNETIACFEEQNKDLKDKNRDLEKKCGESEAKLLDVHKRASECHRKAFCNESASKDKGGQSSSAPFNVKEHNEMQCHRLQELGVKPAACTNSQGSGKEDQHDKGTDEVKNAMQSMATQQNEYQARMDARLASMEQTNSDSLLAVQTALSEQMEQLFGQVVNHLNQGVGSQLTAFESNLTQLFGQQLQAFAQNLTRTPAVDDKVMLGLMMPFFRQMETRMEKFMREITQQRIVAAAPDTATNEQVEALQAEATKLRAKSNRQKSKIATLEATLKEVTENPELIVTDESPELKALRGEIFDLKIRKEKAEASVKAQHDKIDEKERQLQNLESGRYADRNIIDSYEKEAEEYVKTQDHQKETIESQAEIITSLNDDNDAKDKLIEKLLAENNALKASAASKKSTQAKRANYDLLKRLDDQNKVKEVLEAGAEQTTQVDIDLTAENKKIRTDVEKKEQTSTTDQVPTVEEPEGVIEPDTGSDAPLMIEAAPAVEQHAPEPTSTLPPAISTPPSSTGGLGATSESVTDTPPTPPAPSTKPLPRLETPAATSNSVPSVAEAPPTPTPTLRLRPEAPAVTSQPRPGPAVTAAAPARTPIPGLHSEAPAKSQQSAPATATASSNPTAPSSIPPTEKQLSTVVKPQVVDPANPVADPRLPVEGPKVVPQSEPKSTVTAPAPDPGSQLQIENPTTTSEPGLTTEEILAMAGEDPESPPPDTDPLPASKGKATASQPGPATGGSLVNAGKVRGPVPPEERKKATPRPGKPKPEQKVDFGRRVLPPGFNITADPAADVNGTRQEASVTPATATSPFPSRQPPTPPPANDGSNLKVLFPRDIWNHLPQMPLTIPQAPAPSAGFQIPQDPLKFTTSFDATSAQADGKKSTASGQAQSSGSSPPSFGGYKPDPSLAT